MRSLIRVQTPHLASAAAALAWLAPIPFVGPHTANAKDAAFDASPMHAALEQLSAEGKFSGSVVIHGAEGVRFARGYGWADPFAKRAFTPETPVDSGSLAKPVTAAAVLSLAKQGKIDLDEPVRRYLPRYPHEMATVRHLLAHSAGLPMEARLEPLAGKTNEMIMDEIADRRLPPEFTPGRAFNYCNFCYTTLALLVERVSGASYSSLVQERAALPAGVTIRPLRLADWRDRAIGYRRTSEGELRRADSYESEAFYGSGNLSISASQLAQWGAQWWQPQLAPIRTQALVPARIDGKASGLSWGSWYCSPRGEQCHYLGHHEGFHHMLYWDAERRVSVAMVSNNTLAPALQQRLQRALVEFAQGRNTEGLAELRAELPDNPVQPGSYRLSNEETVVVSRDDDRMFVVRAGLRYEAYPIDTGIRYVPGLDTYLAGASGRRLHWLNLYEDMLADAKPATCGLTSRSLIEKATALRQVSGVPALSAAVVVNGTVVAKGTVGVRAEGGAPALDSDAWHIGSITKPITATLTARFVERDLLRFSSTLEELGADLLAPSERSYANVTVRDLLSHHSGIDKVPEEDGFGKFRGDVRPLPDQRRVFARLALSRAPWATPGSKFAYANLNYVVTGSLLERLAKDSWENQVAKEVLAPLGLKSAGFGPPGGADQSRAPVGHELTDGKARPVRPGDGADIPAVMRPAGGIHMTMEDLAMFGYRHAAGEFEADGYLSPETYRLLHTARGEGAALGWMEQEWRGHRLLSHTGSNGYWYAMLAVQPEKRLAIAVASNVDPEGGADMAVHELVSALMRAAILGECLNQ